MDNEKRHRRLQVLRRRVPYGDGDAHQRPLPGSGAGCLRMVQMVREYRDYAASWPLDGGLDERGAVVDGLKP